MLADIVNTISSYQYMVQHTSMVYLIFDLTLAGCRSVRAHAFDIVVHGHNTGIVQA